MKEQYSWTEVEDAVQGLANILQGSNIKCIAAIGRGGCIPAALIAHKLHIDVVDYVNYNRENGFFGDSLTDRLHFDDVLFVGDATETGGTTEFIKARYGDSVMVAVLFCSESTQSNRPDFVGCEYSGECPKMPWEVPL